MRVAEKGNMCEKAEYRVFGIRTGPHDNGSLSTCKAGA